MIPEDTITRVSRKLFSGKTFVNLNLLNESIILSTYFDPTWAQEDKNIISFLG